MSAEEDCGLLFAKWISQGCSFSCYGDYNLMKGQGRSYRNLKRGL